MQNPLASKTEKPAARSQAYPPYLGQPPLRPAPFVVAVRHGCAPIAAEEAVSTPCMAISSHCITSANGLHRFDSSSSRPYSSESSHMRRFDFETGGGADGG